MSTISQAIVSKDKKLAFRLIEDREGINQRDIYGGTPLIQACILNDIEIVRMLIKYGADPNKKSITGGTALHWAVSRGNLEITRTLLDSGANPNAYGTSGQPPLVTARLRHQRELVEELTNAGASVEFAKDCIIAKRIGHRFELKGHAKILNPLHQYVEVNYEGFIIEFSLNLINNALFHFLDSNPFQEKFSELEGPLRKIYKALTAAQTLIPPIFRDRFDMHKESILPLLENDLLIIPIGYQGHAITFIKYGNLFARCDRGVNKYADTSVVYKMHNPYAFNRKFVENLLYESHDEQYIHHDIKTFLSLSALTALPTKQQVSGNCSWANTEASVVTALYMILYVRHEQTNEVDKTTKISKYSMKLFNTWTNWDKDVAIDECIKAFNSTDIEAKRASYANMLAAVLFQSLDYMKPYDVKKAERILTVLTTPEFKPILASYTKSYCRPQGGEKGVKFTKLLLRCNLDILSLDVVTDKSQASTDLDDIEKAAANLLKSAAVGDLELMKAILKRYPKLNVNQTDQSGSTALMYAAWMGHLNIVRYLVSEYKANKKIVNDRGGSAEQYAKLSGHKDIEEYLS